MGLLQHMERIRAGDLTATRKIPGTMDISYNVNKISDYHSFAGKFALERSAVLVPFGKRFFMRYEHGFDAESIFRSISSTDFWNGTLPPNHDWYSFTGSSIEPFYQLFSQEVSDSLESLHIKSLAILADVPIKAIMIVADKEFDKENIDASILELGNLISNDISNRVNVFSSPVFSSTPEFDEIRVHTVSIQEAIAEVADNMHADAETLDILSPVLLYEVNNRVRKLLSPDDHCFPGNEFKIRILFSQAKSLDADLLQFQLQKHLAPFFGASTSKVFVESAGNQ